MVMPLLVSVLTTDDLDAVSSFVLLFLFYKREIIIVVIIWDF